MKLKHIIALFFLMISLMCYTQEGTIVFDKVLHNFELIEEERGLVVTEFFFTNTAKEKYQVINTKSSCGCATIGVSKEWIKKGDTLSLMVAYDPTGLPGKFNKAITVTFKDEKGTEIERHLSIKGITVSLTAKDILAQNDTAQKEKNVIFYFKQDEIDKKIDTKQDSYNTLIERATKVALMHRKVSLLITIYHHKPDYAFEKLLKDAYEKINSDLLEAGLPEQSIVFLDPKVELSSKDEYLQVSIINEKSYSTPALEEDVIAEFSLGQNSKIKINSAQQLALPVYFQYFKNGLRDIDTTSAQFKSYLEELTSQIKGREELVELVAVSSASKWVFAGDDFDNGYIADLRGNNALKTLKNNLKKNGVEIAKIEDKLTNKVIGPPMNKRNYVSLFYEKFQYIKIIPVYKVKTKEQRGASQYIYFYKESTETINTREKLFLAFVDQLEYLIRNEGYATVTIEGSSSKTNVSTFSSNEKLAYARVEDLKSNLERELYKRGVNPQRLDVVEEQALVQGPEADNGSKAEHEKAQYVKAIIAIR